ncbi:MAG: hypothetical protein HYX92_18150 [Chloroflexi bacterium]|nr:hypothetical protein [Chloroflexota bacterium]
MTQPELKSRRFRVVDSAQDFYQYAYDKGWTDGLPVIPPTEERVREMVGGRVPGELIAKVPPRSGLATVETIAVNAVMAGCLPEYLPVIIAGVRAMCEPVFKLDGIQPTTNPAGPGLIVNGPIRQRIDLNCGGNALGPGRRANATIGRAIRLILLNIGGGTPQMVDKATLGYPGKYTFCLGENEEDSPWEPLHVERGFKPQESTVTMISAAGITNANCSNSDAGEVLRILANSLARWGSNDMIYCSAQPALLFSPSRAKLLASQGYSRQAVKEYLWENTAIPASELPYKTRPRGSAWKDGDIARPVSSPDDIIIAVAGAPERSAHVVVVECFPDGAQAVTKLIED